MSLVATGIGVSQKDNLIEAVKEAAKESKKELGEGKKPKLLMLFCTYTYPMEQYQKAQELLYEVFGNDRSIPLVGGTTMGFFAKDKYFFDIDLFGMGVSSLLKATGKIFKPLKFNGTVVLSLHSDFLQIGTGIGENSFQNPQLAGKNSIQMALDNLQYNPQIAYLAMVKKGKKDIGSFRPVNGFLLTPGTNHQNRLFDSEIIEGVISVSKTALRIQGGGLCSGYAENKFLPGYAFYNGKVFQGSVISIVLGSDLEIGYGVGTGAKPLADIGLVTKIRDNFIIEEINGKPAVDVFIKVLEENTEIKKKELLKVDSLGTYLGVKGYFTAVSDPRAEFFWPVFISGLFDNRKGLEMMVPIKKGTSLILGLITKDSAKRAAVDAVKLMIEDISSKDFNFVLFFSCAARGIILGKEYFNEIKKIKETLDNKITSVFGICSVGEQAFYKTGSPLGTGGTITTMGISNKLYGEETSN